jgi:hypothetical protein
MPEHVSTSRALITKQEDGSIIVSLTAPIPLLNSSHLPPGFEIREYDYYVLIGTCSDTGGIKRPLFPGLHLSAKGRVLNAGLQYLNELDARDYSKLAAKHAKRVVSAAVHGKLPKGGWAMASHMQRVPTRKIIWDAVIKGKLHGYLLGLSIDLYPNPPGRIRSAEAADAMLVLEALQPDTYKALFGPVRDETRELDRYARQLSCEYEKYPFNHPREWRAELLQLVRGGFMLAANMHKSHVEYGRPHEVFRNRTHRE